MSAEPVITITTKEGVFLYDGVDAEGRARWPFYRRKRNGDMESTPTPKRWKNIIKSQQRRSNER